MSWLGEHITSISGKLQDITKVVNENLGNSFLDGSLSGREQGDDYNIHNQDASDDQDHVISQLVAEKEELEKKIVLLDEQHQETVNELLLHKSGLAAENRRLKSQLLEKGNVSDSAVTLPDSCPESCELKGLDEADMSRHEDLARTINPITVLVPLKSCHGSGDDGSDALCEQISKLEKMYNSLKSQGDVSGPAFSCVSKIADYLKYLQFVSDHREYLLPFLQETAGILSKLHCDAGLESNKEMKMLHDCDNAATQCNIIPPRVSDTGTSMQVSEPVSQQSQTDIAPQTDAFHSLSPVIYSVSCQTDSETAKECEQCLNKSVIVKELTFKNTGLQEKLHQLIEERQCSAEGRQSVALQTDGCCDCEALKGELQKTSLKVSSLMKDMQQEKADLIRQLEKQTEMTKNLMKSLHDKEAVIAEKDKTIALGAQEVISLKNLVGSLQSKLSGMEKQAVGSQPNGQGPQFQETKESHLTQTNNIQDQLSMSVSDNDKLLLQQKLKALDMEKNRLLSVLSDKSRECSSLKSEVHRLTNIVASEKQALLKLQQDNKDLKENKDSSVDPDLAKEALQNLSHLVRSKDVEIEALKQKNNTLSEVIKQTCSGSDQIQSVISERDDLLKQINNYKANREKIMVSYNNKDQECRTQLAEIKGLKSELESKSRELDLLQQQYYSISQQYEEKQKALIDMQNEVIMLKQNVSDSKQACEEASEKHQQLLDKLNSDSSIAVSKDELSGYLSEIENLKVSQKSSEKLISEKDCLIHDLSQQIKSMKLTCSELEKTVSELKRANENVGEKLGAKQAELQKALAEKDQLGEKLGDKVSESNLLREMNERLSMAVKEKEFSIQSLQDKIASLSKVILGNVAHDGESSSMGVDHILANSEDMYSKAQQFHRERDETLLALSQSQQESQELRNEVQRLKNVEEHLKGELDRLRKHLLQVEENYTAEALRAEEREKELRDSLAELEQSVKLSSSASLDASHQASVQIASLQEQISIIANQRDQALGQMSELEDKVQQYAASLNNLQLVLEQMQKGHDQKLKELERKWNSKLSESDGRCSELQVLLEKKQEQLDESKQALEAATRLSEQLDSKEQVIQSLKEELAKSENKLRSAAQEIDSMKSHSEGKVDRIVMKSLVLGYFSTPPGQKSEVVRLLARVLDFNQEEMAKAGIVVSRNTGTVEHKGLLSSLLGRLPSLNPLHVPRPLQQPAQHQNSDDQSQSFTTLFVRFLETESQPIVHVPLPAEKMARELTSKSHSSKNTVKHYALTSTPGKSSLLVGIDAAFPTFGPLPAIENSTPAPTILKRVLN